MDFGEVLSRAWQIIRKHKALWIFGILANCAGGSGGGGGSGNTGARLFEGDNAAQQMERFFERTFESIPPWTIALILGGILLIILILAVLFILLATVGRIGLIRGTARVEEGAESLSAAELFSESLPHFWRVFGLHLLAGLATLLVVLFFGALFAGWTLVTFGIGALCLIPLACLAVPLFWMFQALLEQATIAIVLDGLGIADGLRRGWELLKTHLGAVIVMALALYLGVGLIGGFIVSLPLMLALAPLMAALIGAAIFETGRAIGGGLVISAFCLVAYLPVLIVLNGLLRAYIGSAWTLTYLRLQSQPPPNVEAP